MDENFIKPCNPNCSFCFLNYALVLSQNNLFRGLTPSEIGVVIKKVHHQVRSFSRGDMVLQAGLEYLRLMIIVEGAVVAEMVDFEGRVLKIEQLEAPNTIASAFLFGNDNHLPVMVTALNDTRVILLHRDDLILLFQQDTRIMRNFLDMISTRAQFLSSKIKMLGFQTIKGKLAHYLLQMYKLQQSTKITVEKTQNELAEMFGVARPSLSRALRELHAEGVVNARGRHVELLNLHVLKDFLK